MATPPTNQVLNQWLELLVYDVHLSQIHLKKIADALEHGEKETLPPYVASGDKK